MNNIRSTIVLLYKRISPDRIFKNLKGDINANHYVTFEVFQDKNISHRLLEELEYYSHNEVDNTWTKAKQDWGRALLDGGDNRDREKNSSVFGLLETFTNAVLRMERNNPTVSYEHLLKWRELSNQLGEDILTCSFVANSDVVSRHRRTFFAWRPILGNNNIRLRNLLSKGMAENHFHLFGSAPIFEISWVALMNRIKERKQEFDQIAKEGNLDPDIQYGNEEQTDIYILTIKATYIRLLLFYHLFVKNKIEEENFFSYKKYVTLLGNTSNHKESAELFLYINDIQEKINSYRITYGLKSLGNENVSQLDYAITKDMAEHRSNANIILCGERMLMYSCFRAIKQKEECIVKRQDLFYAYLIIKERLRKELIQINSNVGFTNFKLYQDRKTIFLHKRPLYEKKMAEMAICSSFQNQWLETIEARIKPKNTKNKLRDDIKRCDEDAKQNTTDDRINRFLKLTKEKENSKTNTSPTSAIDQKHHYVLHFTKSKDKICNLRFVNESRCRDHFKRKEVKQETMAIDGLLCSLNPVSKRILGIDGAASEFDNRPEAFAQAFRFLKNKRDNGRYGHLKDDTERPLVRATFHAGEDFYDIVDGLRAIDETIKFLNLTEGDRIGHALALGINARDFYLSKHKCLMLPKQWHLDNICWLISRINKYNLHQFSTFGQYLRWEFQMLFEEVYANLNKKFKEAITPELYYEAWKLRGDDPYKYGSDGKLRSEQNLTFWDSCGLNEVYPSKGCKRISETVNRLYYEYHFNSEIKKQGEEIKRFEIKSEYIKVVNAVQKCFQKEIQAKHLAIETNPSSNVQIGTFKRYDKHPLVNFYNLGLETDPEKIKSCPQLFVSINTDDQGVFNTYLENEYALMALALEKMEDEDGNKIYNPTMIYDWLDRIRAMGMEMRFGKE
jgi:adenosine deaminase